LPRAASIRPTARQMVAQPHGKPDVYDCMYYLTPSEARKLMQAVSGNQN
jgi:hypothetical protein